MTGAERIFDAITQVRDDYVDAAGDYRLITISTPIAQAGDEMPITPLEPLPELYAALRRMNGDKDLMVPCRMHYGLSYAEEAELCWKLDQAKSRLTLAQSITALKEAGTDEEISAILRLMEVNGFKWTLDKDIPGEYEIRAARAVLSAYRLLGQDAFDRMLRLLAGAWQGAPSSLKGGFLSGMALFVKTYETELVDRTAIKRLSAIDPEEVIRRGKTDFSTNRAALRYARVLWKKYNCQRGGRKLAYRFKE